MSQNILNTGTESTESSTSTSTEDEMLTTDKSSM